ncbi:hypothetical protein SBA3_2630017 [Candidatus Sulfopaludibacter sp. SbA3]|nr:hypothetical protein SBA3_2630017 [Candidatus Sulfopaludibacter sp. SbA3]
MTIVSIGEVLWDVFEDSERLGGAPFNFAVHAARLGHQVSFVSAVGDDDRGAAVRKRAGELGLRTGFLQTIPGVATGTVSVRVDCGGQPDFTIHRPAAYDALQLSIRRAATEFPGHPGAGGDAARLVVLRHAISSRARARANEETGAGAARRKAALRYQFASRLLHPAIDRRTAASGKCGEAE